jgi:hypothetical protein
MMSKGSGRRPTDHKKYSDNWERIFNDKPDLHKRVIDVLWDSHRSLNSAMQDEVFSCIAELEKHARKTDD